MKTYNRRINGLNFTVITHDKSIVNERKVNEVEILLNGTKICTYIKNYAGMFCLVRSERGYDVRGYAQTIKTILNHIAGNMKTDTRKYRYEMALTKLRKAFDRHTALGLYADRHGLKFARNAYLNVAEVIYKRMNRLDVMITSM